MERRVGLDILRAIAIGVVVEQHGRSIVSPVFPQINNLGHTDGVDLFFVLSGFLITNILIKVMPAQNAKFSDLSLFLKRRWLRTLPLFYLIFILNIIFFSHSTDFQKSFQIAFFVFNLTPPFLDHSFFSESWSLAVEEIYYLLFPSLAFLLLKKNNWRSAILISSLTLISVCFLFRAMVFVNLPNEALGEPTWSNYFRIVSLCRLDAIAFGSLMSWLYYNFRQRLLNFRVPLFVVSFIAMIFFDRTFIVDGSFGFGFFSCVVYFSLYPFLVSLTLPFLNELRVPDGSGRVFTFVSKISFSMYLIHNSFLRRSFVAINENTDNQYAYIVYGLYWVSTIIISYFLYEKFEKLVLAWRENRYPELSPISPSLQGEGV